MADINFAPGAEEVALATMLANMLEGNLERPEKIKDFNALNTTAYIHAKDIGAEVTLVFFKGSLTFHGGKLGKPDISIETDAETLLNLASINIKFGLPYYFDETGLGIVKKLLKGELKIKGMFTHLIPLTRLTKVMSIN